MDMHKHVDCSFNETINITTTLICNNLNITHGHSLSNQFSIAIASYFIFLIAAAVIFNGALIATIASTRTLHSSPNLFIVNLAVCDILVGLCILPFETDFLLRGYYSYGLFVCGLKETIFMFSLPASIFNLFLLTAERFVLIVFPYKHCNVFTRKKIIAMLIFIWSYTIIVALFPIIMDRNATVVYNGHCHLTFPFAYVIYQLGVNFIFPLLCIIMMNFAIYRVASRHSRVINKQFATSHERKRKNTMMNMLPSNFKAAKHIMVLVTSCITCWLAYIVLVIWNILCHICHPREVTWTGNAINYSSILLNPLLYGLLNKKVRKVFLPARYYRKKDAEGVNLQGIKM